MVFVSQTFTVDGIPYVVTDEAKAAELALMQKLIDKLEGLRMKL